MPTVVSHVKLIRQVPTGGPERVSQLWEEFLTTMAQRINERRKARIPDGEAFIARLAGPSRGRRQFVNPAFTSRSGMDATELTANQAANLMRSFEKYNKKLDQAFETVDGVPAKKFIDLVKGARSDFAKGIAERTLAFTGSKLEGLGITALATLWLTGDPTTEGHLRAGDIIVAGGPYKVCPDAKKPGLKAMLNQRLIQAGTTIVKAEFAPAVIARQNQLTCEQVQGFVDTTLNLAPFTVGGDSRVDYIVEDGVMYLEVKVSLM